jgi:hypothetical protein
MKREEDFSLEDNKDVMNSYEEMALKELASIKKQLARQQRRDWLLYLRRLPRAERKAAKIKFGRK